MRIRETELFNNPLTAVSHDRANCAAGFSNVNWGDTEIGVKRIEDTKAPKYHSIIREGGVLPYLPVLIRRTERVINSKLDYTVTKTSSPSCVISYGEWLLPASFYTIPSLPSHDAAISSQVTNAAIAAAKSEAWDALTFIAELNKTSGMIANRFNRIFDLAEKLKRRSSRDRLRSFNNLWLEYRYGWRPLVYDINSAIRQLMDHPHRFHEGHTSAVVDLGASTTKITDGVVGRLTCTCVRTGTRTYRGFAMAVGSFGKAPEFRPFQTAWELIPFSFVVDWFFDVSSFIAAVTPIPGVEIRACGFSIRDSWELVQGSSATLKPGVANHTVVTNWPGEAVTTEESYIRTPSSSSIPSFFPRLNTLRLIDLGALILQRVLRFRNIR